MSPLLLLPQEILTRIATYLPVEDCYELAVTCRQLQHAAETQIWASIDVRPFHHSDDIDVDSEEDEEDSDAEISGVRKTTRTRQNVSDLINQPAEILNALNSNADREKMVRKARIGLHESTMDETMDIIGRTGKTLSNLEVDFADEQWSSLRELTRDFHARMKEEEGTGHMRTFHRVHRCFMPISDRWATEVKASSRLYPRIESMRLRQVCAIEAEDKNTLEWGDITNLTRLELQLQCPSSRHLLLPLLKHFKNLDTLVIDAISPAVNFEDDEKDKAVIKALREHEGIRRFEWNSTGIPGYIRSFDAISNLFDGTGWENLRVMSMTGGVEMESETYLEVSHRTYSLASRAEVPRASIFQQHHIWSE